MIVVLSLVLAGTALHGLTTGAHVVGSTQSSQAETLYDQTVGSAAGAAAHRRDRGQFQELHRR